MRRPRPAVALAIAVLAVLAWHSSASAQRGAGTAVPDPVPAPPLGHPGNPVQIKGGSFHVSGTAGMIVHVHLTDPLEGIYQVDDYNRRVTWHNDTNVAMVALRPEREQDTGLHPYASIGVASPIFLCQQADTCQQEHAALYRPYQVQVFGLDANGSAEYNKTNSGDYILALLGPVGAHIDLTYRDFYARNTPSEVTNLYAMPYTAGSTVDLPKPTVGDPQHPNAVTSQFLAPMLARRVLSGLALAVENAVNSGGGYSYQICLIFGRSRPSENNTPGRNPLVCGQPVGGATGDFDAVYGTDPDTGMRTNAPLATLEAFAATSDNAEDPMSGGSYVLSCGDTHCLSRGYSFNVAVDS